MTAAIVPVGLTSSEPTPGIFMEVNFAQGPSVGSGLTRAILVLANKLAAGSATVDTEIYGPDTDTQLQTEPQMIALAGAGSEAHRMFRRMAAVTGGENGPPIYWLFVTESAGASATGTVVIATNATGNATHRLWVGDEFVDTGIFTSDTPTTIAAAIAANVNAKTHWPVTASAATGTVTLTAKQKGLRGNWIRFQAAIIAPSPIGTTTTATADAFLSGGTTADSNTTALATILPRWYYHIVSAAEDATQVGAAASQLATQSLAINGIRQRLFFGSTNTLANTITIAVGINSPLAEVTWSEKSPWTPAELAANAAVVYALEEADELNFRTNFIGYGKSAVTQPLWKVPASRAATAWPSPATIRSALNNGITPIGVDTFSKKTFIVDRFTTRSLNGSQPDSRIREAHKVTISHRVADVFGRALADAGEGMVIADDPPPGLAPPPKSITPNIAKGVLYRVLDRFAGASPPKLQKLNETKANAVVQRETDPASRIGVRCPLSTIDNFRQAAVVIDQVA